MESIDKNARGSASQFFVAGELCRRGYVAVVTMGNTPNTDILVSNSDGTNFVHVQVKTYIPGRKTVSVGKKAERFYGERFVWILAGIPPVGSDRDFEYFVIPSSEVSKNVSQSHRIWLDTPGRGGQIHNDNDMRTINLPPGQCMNGWEISKYLNNWSLLDDLLCK